MIGKAGTDLYETTWGNIRLWCSSISTENGRTQVIHQPITTTSVDDFEVVDRGPAPRRVTCTLQFDDMVNETTPPLERLKAFLAQVNSGSEDMFTHPIEGSFFVHVDTCSYEIDEDTNVANAQVVFIASGTVLPIQAAKSVSASLIGDDAVFTMADALADVLDDVDIDSTVPEDAKAAVDSWSTDDGVIPTQQVLKDAAAINAAITDLIEVENLEDELELWDAYIAAVRLQDAFRTAASAATSETDTIFFMKITAPTTVLALITRVYGGAEAATKERQFRALNDVGGVLDVGTEVAMPAITARRAA